MRPSDLVGAITAEAHVAGSAIGAIRIEDGFSLVDVVPGVADGVLAALRGATLRGRMFPVGLDRGGHVTAGVDSGPGEPRPRKPKGTHATHTQAPSRPAQPGFRPPRVP